MLKRIFDFFIFSSLFIAGCAVVMVYQLELVFPGLHFSPAIYAFIFFSTVCSYNFHWYLSGEANSDSERVKWALQYKSLHLVLYFIGLAGSIAGFIWLRAHWFWIGLGVFFTFLYSAPKIPQRIFMGLRKIAIGKTLFLAVVWTYVTAVLPILMAGDRWLQGYTWLALSRFFLVYAICILFDYRDREEDKLSGIKSMITWLNERGIDNLFALSIGLFVVFTVLLGRTGHTTAFTILQLIPGVVVTAIYRYCKAHFSDYLYYFVLDGLMMLSGLLMILVHFTYF